MTYKVVRKHAHPLIEDVELDVGLSKEEAQAYCKDPESSSRTCTNPDPIAYTAAHGAWFNAYYEED